MRYLAVTPTYVLLAGLVVSIAGIPWFVSAQTGTTTTEQATSTEAIEESSTETTTQWYEIEPLSGGPVPAGDFVLGPGKVELEINPGESKTINLLLSNRIGKEHRFNLSVEDATGSQNPEKTVDLLGSQRGPYTLREYISIPDYQLTLEHNQRARIPVTISVPPDAEPGGRYGSVLVDTVAVEREADRDGQVQPQSPVVARIGTLFFITIPGDIERSGSLADFTTVPKQGWYAEPPITFGITFVNDGSVHLAPYGYLSITNLFGQEVGYQELDPWFVLPNAERFREVIWNGGGFHIGRYTAHLTVHRGYDDMTDEMEVHFWILPWQPLLAVFVGIFVIVFLIRSFFSRFEFRRKV